MTTLPNTPGSVVVLDGFLTRTRWDNWVTEDGSILTDADLAEDIALGHEIRVLFDAGDPDEDPSMEPVTLEPPVPLSAAVAAFKHMWNLTDAKGPAAGGTRTSAALRYVFDTWAINYTAVAADTKES